MAYKGCMCVLCADYRVQKSSEIMACGCLCHYQGFTGHDNLCCPTPNVTYEQAVKYFELESAPPVSNVGDKE